jgi:carbonic anhydrase
MPAWRRRMLVQQSTFRKKWEESFMRLMAKFPAIIKSKPTNLVVVCFDSGLHYGNEGLIREILGLKQGLYVFLSIGGSVTPMAHPKDTPSRCKGVARQILLACDRYPSITDIAVVMHSDCGFYVTVPKHLHSHEKEKRDLQMAGSHLMEILPGKKIRLFYQEITDDGESVAIYETDCPKIRESIPRRHLFERHRC